MKTNYLLATILLIMCISSVTATHEQINDTLYIYNATSVKITANEGQDTNIDKVIVSGGVCNTMKLSIGIIEDYEFDYYLNWAPNETMYYTSILTIKQEEIDSSWYGLYKNIKRTLYIDAVEVATYNTTSVLNAAAMNTVGFVSLDRRVTFGSETVNNATLFFSEMKCDDQQAFLYNESGSNVAMRFETCNVAGSGFDGLVLGGLTGIFMSGLKKLPFIGDALYNTVYPVMVIIQYTIDFTFTFLNLIIYDWWYAILLLECICMFIALRAKGYTNVMEAYINTHFQIITFVYHKIILPMINMFINILNTIKNMIQWW